MAVIYMDTYGNLRKVYPTEAPCSEKHITSLLQEADESAEVDDTFPVEAHQVGSEVVVTVHLMGYNSPAYFRGPTGWWLDDDVNIA